MARGEIKIKLIKSIAAEGIAKKGLFLNQAYALAKTQFDDAKQEMMADFNEHSITQEIEAGATTDNESGTLGREGNLFSFIGFTAGEDPISEVREVLDDNTRLIRTSRAAVHDKKDNSVKYRFPVVTASLEGELAAASPVPFSTAKSWVLLVEGRGFSNINALLNRYLYDETRTFNTSHSGPAIEIKNNLGDYDFSPRPYLSEIINKFIKKFQ